MQLKRRSDMDDFQVQIADLIYEHEKSLVILPVGGGKTVSTLTAISDLLDIASVRRILVIAPLRVAEEVWPEEINGWEHLAHIPYSVVTGSEAGRLFALRVPARIYLINKENVQWLWKTMRELKLRPFDMIVVDESRMLADGKKRSPVKKVDGVKASGGLISRFGAFMKIRAMPGRMHTLRVVLLTGTPFSEGIIDAWGQVYALDLGERLGTTKEAFLARWFESDYGGYKYKPRKGATEEIVQKCSDVIIAPDISEYLEKRKVPVFPKKVWVTLSKEEMARYKKFERTLYEEETDIEAISSGILTNKLLQFANGSMYKDEDEAVHIHDRKLHALEELVDELHGENVLVAYSYKFDLARIRKRFPKAVVLSEDRYAYEDWNKGKIGMLLAHPASAGHGLNLQFGGHHAIWYGLCWSIELYEQFNGRLPRRGQANEWVMLHHILARGTKDELVYDKMVQGTAAQQALIREFHRDLSLEYGRRRAA